MLSRVTFDCIYFESSKLMLNLLGGEGRAGFEPTPESQQPNWGKNTKTAKFLGFMTKIIKCNGIIEISLKINNQSEDNLAGGQFHRG